MLEARGFFLAVVRGKKVFKKIGLEVERLIRSAIGTTEKMR
jgi:hypothetical protein